ncbi:MAG TPA: thymidine kinase, partial [Armatimonadota bacterium]|nr:thymidine kinase [Armatimonadota bacterium]
YRAGRTVHRVAGRIEVITGPMFSGKSTELLRRLNLAQIARKRTAAFKHASDIRFSEDAIATHTAQRGWALAVSSALEVQESWLARGAAVIGIDEAQFFEEDLVEVAERLADRGKRVIVAGLNQDSFGKPFGPMPALLARADDLFLARAVCVVCGEDATRTFRKPGAALAQVLIGADQEYEARCRFCWKEGESAKEGGPDAA